MTEDIHWQKYAARFKTFPAQLEKDETVPGLAVCIPVYGEPELISTLDSLWSCELPATLVEVFILFNMSSRMNEEEVRQHKQAWQDCLHWVSKNLKQGLRFSPFYLEMLPDPKGGVGWARKLVLDEAARKLDQNGILLCLDSDCLVEKNYLRVVYDYFRQHQSCDAASIYYEHNLENLGQKEKQAIVQYELHLRYLVHAMRWAGHPFAFQTVGSAMAVRRKGYLAHGGMNTRQAGEDFYFLQKFIEVDALHEIMGTAVFPSARTSHRVPFGTGRAMLKLLSESTDWMTTDFEIFRLVKPLLQQTDHVRSLLLEALESDKVDNIFTSLHLHPSVISFLTHINFLDQCKQIVLQTTNAGNFRKRFFRYFNSFMMIRYAHYMRDHFFPDVPVIYAAGELANAYIDVLISPPGAPAEDYLKLFRSIDNH